MTNTALLGPLAMISLRKLLKYVGLTLSPRGEVTRLYHPQNPSKKAGSILCPTLMQRKQWKHGDVSLEQLQNSQYYNLWKKYNGGHKKYSYFELYDKLFKEYSGKQPRILEIGVYKGASLRTWREFLGQGSIIVGIDINPDCARHEDSAGGIHVRIGSQADESFLKSVTDEFGPFQFIIDDGSHLTHHVIATFNYAFLHSLIDGGIYFIEDLNTSYWADYRTSKYSAMDLVLSLCELTHQFYFENKYSDYALSEYKQHYEIPLVSTL